MRECGVSYYAEGGDYIEEAKKSARSIKIVHPELNITLHSNHDVESEYFDNIKIIPKMEDPFLTRIKCMKNPPYKKTLYLDTDTYVCASIMDIFDMLGRFDIALPYDSVRVSNYSGFKSSLPPSFPEFNGGVIAIKNTNITNNFVNRWFEGYENYVDEDTHDQPFLRQALFDSPRVNICTLPPEYNCRPQFPGYVQGKVRILHSHEFEHKLFCKQINEFPNRKKVFTGKIHRKIISTPRINHYPVAQQRYPGTSKHRTLISLFIKRMKQVGVVKSMREALLMD